MWLWLLFLTALINIDNLPELLNTKPWWLWTICVLGALGITLKTTREES